MRGRVGFYLNPLYVAFSADTSQDPHGVSSGGGYSCSPVSPQDGRINGEPIGFAIGLLGASIDRAAKVIEVWVVVSHRRSDITVTHEHLGQRYVPARPADDVRAAVMPE